MVFQKNNHHDLDNKALENLKVLFQDVIPTQKLDELLSESDFNAGKITIIRLFGESIIKNNCDEEISEQEKLQRLDTLSELIKSISKRF